MKNAKSVSFDEAVELSLSLVSKAPYKVWVSIFNAVGRVLVQDLVCKKNLPSYNNAAMDGFAFKHSEIDQKLSIKTTILAGQVVDACLGENECYKIMTGAKVPDDVDTIIPFEECQFYDDTYIIAAPHIKKGNALRLKGEEESVGMPLLGVGDMLGSREIALLASQGISMVHVYKKLTIAVFSTGNELKTPWETANDDEIYDINALALISLLKEHGFEANYCGVIPDNLEAATEYFQEMKQYDVLLTSGGVSMGEADFVERALIANGFEASFHGINIKPGKPTMMGKMGDTIVASMPGNPLAAYVNAFVFLLPVLKKLQGQKNYNNQTVKVTNLEAFKMKSGRVNLVLGAFSKEGFKVYEQNKYGSGMVKPLVNSNAVWVSDEKSDKIEVGDTLEIYLM